MLGTFNYYHQRLEGVRNSITLTTLSPKIRQVTNLTTRLRSPSVTEKELRVCYYKAIIIVVGQHHHLDYKIPLPCLQTSHTLTKPPNQSTTPNSFSPSGEVEAAIYTPKTRSAHGPEGRPLPRSPMFTLSFLSRLIE